MKLPMKSALFMKYVSGDAIWDYQAIEEIVNEYGCNTEYYKLHLRFGLMELAGGGLLEAVDMEIDDGSHFKQDSVVCKYKVTDFGRERAKVLE